MFPSQMEKLRFDGKCVSKNDYADCCKKMNAHCAIVNGHLECFKYSHKNKSGDYYCDLAAEYGQKECLQFAHENGYPWSADTCFLGG